MHADELPGIDAARSGGWQRHPAAIDRCAGLAVDPADTLVSAADPHWQHTSDAPLCAVAGAMPRAAAAAHRTRRPPSA